MKKEELTALIYDTLFHNTVYPQLDLQEVDSQSMCGAVIEIYAYGKKFLLTVQDCGRACSKCGQETEDDGAHECPAEN